MKKEQTITEGNSRSMALNWWRSISTRAQIDYVKYWQEKLPMGTMAKNWGISLVMASSSCIEKIWQTIHNNNKSIEHDTSK